MLTHVPREKVAKKPFPMMINAPVISTTMIMRCMQFSYIVKE